MGFRDTFLKPFKKLKYRLAGGGRKPRRGDACVTGGGVNLAGSALQPVPHAVAEGTRGREGDGTGVEGSKRGPDPSIGVVVESGPSQETAGADGERIHRVDPPPSAPLDSNGGNANGL